MSFKGAVPGGKPPKEGNDTIGMPGGGSAMELRDVQVGATILGYNADTNRMEPDDVAAIYDESRPGHYFVVNDSRSLLPIHRVLVKGDGDGKVRWIDVEKLEIGQQLRLAGGGWEPIAAFGPVFDEETVAFGLGLNPCEGYVSNGVIVCVKEEYRKPRP